MWTDRLEHLPGLAPQPRPGTPEFKALVDELTFALADNGDDPRAMLRVMVARRYWPLGTQVDALGGVRFPATGDA